MPKDKEIVTISPLSNKSGMVTFMLQRQGYNVKTLEEGLKGWSSTFEHSSQYYRIRNGQNIKVVQIRKIGKGCMSYIVSLENTNTTTINNKINNNAENEVIVIDPVFPVNEYIRIANTKFGKGARITKVFDTHLHADHVSSARDLANKTDAQLYLSSYEDYSQERYQKQDKKQCIFLKEGDISTLEKINKSIGIKIIHTPSHTAGGLCFLNGERLLFTGAWLVNYNIKY